MKQDARTSMKTKRQTAVGAYYRNDTPGGFGLMVDSDAEHLNELLEVTYIAFKRGSRQEQQDFLSGPVYEQLARVSSILEGGAATEDEEHTLPLVFGMQNVLILEREGLLNSDDYNGMVYVYEA